MMRPDQLTPAQRADFLRAFTNHSTFCEESLQLRDRSGSRRPLTQWPSQKKLSAAIGKQQRAGKPVRILVLKTRRSGFTVGGCSHIFRQVPFFPGRKGTIIADLYKPAAVEAFGYINQFQDGYRPLTRHGAGIRLPKLIGGAGEMALRWENQSSLDVYSAERGEIRGGGLHWALFDEVAFWRSAEVTLRAALTMVPELPDTGIIVQSTANGAAGEFWEMCQKAQDPAQASGWLFVFFGWLEDHNNVLTFESRDQAVKLQNSLDREERALHERHGATLEQLNWRRYIIATRFNGRVADFHQEFPTTPDEAFLTSGRPALDHVALSRMPTQEGTEGELKIVEDARTRKLVFMPGAGGALTIWRRPEPGKRYVVGGDPSKGIDVSAAGRGENPDWSVGFVIDGDSGDQVAMLRERLRPVPFAEYLVDVCTWYNYAFLCPEANDAGFIDSIVRTQYPLERIYWRQRDPTDRRPPRIDELGFETTTATRPWLISAAYDATSSMAIIIRSKIALQECKTFVYKPNGKAEHMDGCHDDCVLAIALTEIGRRAQPKKSFNPAGERAGSKIGYYGRQRRDNDDDD